MKNRLDEEMARRGMVQSRSQAQNLIKMGRVRLSTKRVTKPHYMVASHEAITIDNDERYVSRAGFKLASVAANLGLDFSGKSVLDVGSSTGGFTDFALQEGSARVVAVDVGTDQLHPKIRADERVEVHEKTDIRDFLSNEKFDIIVIDVSFISLREILPYIAKELSSKDTQVVAMLKPQFEAGEKLKNRGVIKNNSIRRDILKSFETWVKDLYVIEAKADSEVTGAKGNQERFYLLKTI